MQYWTVEEARAYLPRLRQLLAVVQRATQLAVRARSNGHAEVAAAAGHEAADRPAVGGPGAPDDPAIAHQGDRPPAPRPDDSPGDGDGDGGDERARSHVLGGDRARRDARTPRDLDVRSALAEIEERGIVLRDPGRGLVDFPARHPGGRDILLCWRMGESDLGWWHLPEDGFAGRRPLPLPPEI